MLKTMVLTVLALLAFAGNSLLCRAALEQPQIDAASFATVRTVAGAVVLFALVLAPRRREARTSSGDWRSALALAVYMVAFAYAYLSLDAGTGALILFGAVQITMLTVAVASGERLAPPQALGLALAVAGLSWLLLPGAQAPSVGGALLMVLAGVAWGVYTLRGRGVRDPLRITSSNFVRAVPFVALVSLLAAGAVRLSREGVLLAVTSGAIASGIGYAVWYRALHGLTALRAAIVQLAVPIVAALGGVLLLDEALTMRLITAAVLTLGGVALAIGARSRKREAATEASGK